MDGVSLTSHAIRKGKGFILIQRLFRKLSRPSSNVNDERAGKERWKINTNTFGD
jgi:hypothetical protein